MLLHVTNTHAKRCGPSYSETCDKQLSTADPFEGDVSNSSLAVFYGYAGDGSPAGLLTDTTADFHIYLILFNSICILPNFVKRA